MNVVYAVTNSVVPLEGGGRVMVRVGSHWPADDPVVVAQPSLFSPDPSYGLNRSGPAPEPPARPVEQATAAPGEKRTVRRA